MGRVAQPYLSPFQRELFLTLEYYHSVKSVRMRENTDQKKLRIWTLFTQSIFCEIIMN